MDIAALSVNLQQAKILSSSKLAVTNIALKAAKQNAEMTNEMLGNVTSLGSKSHLGSNIDIRA